jgi:hypothetical protein
VVPFTITAVIVPPVITTWTGKPLALLTATVDAGTEGVVTAPAAGPLTTSDQVAGHGIVTGEFRQEGVGEESGVAELAQRPFDSFVLPLPGRSSTSGHHTAAKPGTPGLENAAPTL